jgi:hypothetical protein
MGPLGCIYDKSKALCANKRNIFAMNLPIVEFYHSMKKQAGSLQF